MYTLYMNHSKIAQVSLVVAIVIIFNMFTSYTISLVYPAPVYQPITTDAQFVEQYTTAEECISVGGQWTEQMPIPTKTDSNENAMLGYCDPEYTARMTYEADRASYEQVVFIVLVGIGAMVIVAAFVYTHAILTPAFAWAGVLSFLIASMRYWSEAQTWLKVLILALALSALVVTALKKFGIQQNNQDHIDK